MDGARGIDFHYDFSYSYCWDHLRYSVRRALLPGVVLKVSNCCRVCMTGNNADELSMTETSLCELDWGYIRPEFNQSVQICSNLFKSVQICLDAVHSLTQCGPADRFQPCKNSVPIGQMETDIVGTLLAGSLVAQVGEDKALVSISCR